ncbi:MAG: hypothetical protein ACOC38_10180 [Promethearchaeia archaeon]
MDSNLIVGKNKKEIQVVRGCPCYKVFGDENLCVNDDDILEVEVIEVDPSLFSLHETKEDMEEEIAHEDNICYCSVYMNPEDNRVYCVSQGWPLRIHGRYVPADEMRDAFRFLSTKDLSAPAEICSECIYKFLLTLSDTYSTDMTKQEQTDEIKGYVDKFSLMIAVKLSQMEGMKTIGTEDDIDKGVDYLAFLRGYLVQLLEQQQFWSELRSSLKDEGTEEWLLDLVEKREKLARLEYQFYSQTLQLHHINDFHLLVRNLEFILKTAGGILSLNQEIHSKIRSEEFLEKAEGDKRLDKLVAYGEKCRAIEHNFANILQILNKL